MDGRPPRATPNPQITACDNVVASIKLIWETALGVQPIDVHDEFLDLGGDSLAAVLICAEIQQRFGISLDIPSLLSYPTVATLAEYVEGQSP
jgi:acyl carrier protein